MRAVTTSKKLNGTARDERLLEATMQLASARHARSQFEQSIVDFTLAADAAARLEKTEAQIDALCGAALASGFLKRTGEMRAQALQAMAIAEAKGASSTKAEGILGYERLFAGDLAAARILLERARSAVTQDDALSQAAFVSGSLGFLYDLQSEYSRADVLFAEALGDRMRLAASCADVLRMIWMRGMTLANQGRISDALQTLHEGMQVGEINGERHWVSRIPNTVGWIYSQILDFETALKYNLQGIVAAQQSGQPEVEANSHLNLSNAYTALGDLNLACRHLSEGERILSSTAGSWLKWRFSIRLELEKANYSLATGDLAKARASATLTLTKAQAALARKHIAWAHKLLADVELLEGNPANAATECRTAGEILRLYPCPLIEWKVLLAASQTALLCGDSDHAERTLNEARESLAVLADSIRDPELRQKFMSCALSTSLDTIGRQRNS